MSNAIQMAEALGETDVEIPEPEEVVLPDGKTAQTSKTQPEDLSIEELQRLLEEKRAQIAKDSKDEGKKVAPPTKAPAGMLWVFNRTPEQFIWQYDSLVDEIEGHDMMLFPERVARHGRKRSLVSLDPIANTAVFQLVLEDCACSCLKEAESIHGPTSFCLWRLLRGTQRVMKLCDCVRDLREGRSPSLT